MDRKSISVQCNKNQKVKDICNNLSFKINTDINSLIFLYGGNKLDLNKIFNEITKENKINILVYKKENEICSKCGKILDNKIIEEIISLNNNNNISLTGLNIQIKNIMDDLMNLKDINYIYSQLNNINVIIDNINNNIKKINNQLAQIKYNNNNNINNYNNKENKKNILKNEIICIYNKQEEEIKLLYDYDDSYSEKEIMEIFKEAKNNINGKNIEICINNKKIPFNYKYKSDEKGDIQVKFIFNKLLTNIGWMFKNCRSLKTIDLSSFKANKINSMIYMFDGCYSLESIDLSSFNTTNVRDMSGMFFSCKSLKSIDLSSFNTTNVRDMRIMFCGCSSLKSIDLSSFNTTKANYMNGMFSGCSSLKSIDLSSFNTNNVKNMEDMLDQCISLSRENIKIQNSDKNLQNEINKIK